MMVLLHFMLTWCYNLHTKMMVLLNFMLRVVSPIYISEKENRISLWPTVLSETVGIYLSHLIQEPNIKCLSKNKTPLPLTRII